MNYRATLCQALNLPATAPDDDVAMRLALLVAALMSATPAGVKAFSAQRGSHSLDSAEDEIARQMGNNAEALKKYGSRIRA